MKAVIIKPGAKVPVIEDVAEIKAADSGLTRIKVKAAAIKNLDIAIAKGTHYASVIPDSGLVVGTDGVGVTKEGKRVYGFSKSGMLSEYALINPSLMVPIPDGLDDFSAAALPNAVMGSAMAIRFRAGIQSGETVLINGATGVTGRVAIQVARHYGAGKIIVTGRNKAYWPKLKELGADQWITLDEDLTQLQTQLRTVIEQTPIDIVLDYLWGASAEVVLTALKGNSGFERRSRYITVGGMTGDTITLSSSILRSAPIELLGSGLGSWTKEQFGQQMTELIPEFYQLAVDGKLVIETKAFTMEQFEQIWKGNVPRGVRAVVQVN